VDKIFADLLCFIFKFRSAELTSAHHGDWAGLNFAYAVKRYSDRIK